MTKKPYQEQLSKFSLLGELPKVETGLEKAWENLKKCTEPFTAQDIIRQQQETINRQKAEIERLQGLLSEWKKEAYKLADSKDEHFKICDEYAEKAKQRYSEMFDEAKGKIKVEAVKEFDELLKEDCLAYPLEKDDLTMLVDVKSYNNLLKEMAGDAE